MKIEMSADINAAIDHDFNGGRVLGHIRNKGGDECICEISHDSRFNEWDCVSPADNLGEIEVLGWVPIDAE